MNALSYPLGLVTLALALSLLGCGTPQAPTPTEPAQSATNHELVNGSTEGCVPDCAGKACGFDGCFAQCGACPSGQACEAGQCVSYTCVPDCEGKACGSDGCGGSCGSCSEDQQCIDATGVCQAAEIDPCGGITYEGCCDGQVAVWCEDGALAESDCSGEPSCGWVADLGYYCGSDGGVDPSGTLPKACPGTGSAGPECTPNCQGALCGSDGCGGSCGTCGEGASCEGGACVSSGGGCGEITYDGCCDGQVATWCEDGELVSDDCSQYDGACGWVEGSGYYCESDGGNDPGGLPKACPGSDPCGGITEEGCCDGQMLRWCEGSSIQAESCPGGCGWGDDEYDCNTDGGEDPTGTFPKACP